MSSCAIWKKKWKDYIDIWKVYDQIPRTSPNSPRTIIATTLYRVQVWQSSRVSPVHVRVLHGKKKKMMILPRCCTQKFDSSKPRLWHLHAALPFCFIKFETLHLFVLWPTLEKVIYTKRSSLRANMLLFEGIRRTMANLWNRIYYQDDVVSVLGGFMVQSNRSAIHTVPGQVLKVPILSTVTLSEREWS